MNKLVLIRVICIKVYQQPEHVDLPKRHSKISITATRDARKSGDFALKLIMLIV